MYDTIMKWGVLAGVAAISALTQSNELLAATSDGQCSTAMNHEEHVCLDTDVRVTGVDQRSRDYWTFSDANLGLPNTANATFACKTTGSRTRVVYRGSISTSGAARFCPSTYPEAFYSRCGRSTTCRQ